MGIFFLLLVSNRKHAKTTLICIENLLDFHQNNRAIFMKPCAMVRIVRCSVFVEHTPCMKPCATVRIMWCLWSAHHVTVYMYRNTCVGVSKIQRKGILLCFSIDLSLKYTLSILLCFHLPTCFIVLFDSLSWNLQHSQKKQDGQ